MHLDAALTWVRCTPDPEGASTLSFPQVSSPPNAAVSNGCHNMDAVPGARNRILQGGFIVTLETRSLAVYQGGIARRR
jgi:hypothetical protein